MLSLNTYQKYLSVTVAKDVSEETAAYILENQDILQGADIEEDWIRVYDGGEAFAHILGYTGKISSEELEELQKENSDYTMNSIVGKSGIEQYMEETLQGKDGMREVYVNNMGRVIQEGKTSMEPVSGNDVYLSIDKDLQIATYKILEQQIAGIVKSNIINVKEFDKTSVKNTSEIRIPIYDVYFALINNGFIDLKQLNSAQATELEQDIFGKVCNKKAGVLEEVRYELSKEVSVYKELSAEIQEYESFIVNELGILDETAIDKEDSTYTAWTKKEEISINEFLLYAINNGWIDLEAITSKEGYLTAEEIYQLVMEDILRQLETSQEFEKKIFKYILKDDIVSGIEICKLLYEQGVLSKDDGEYDALMNNGICAYDFMLRKIEKLEITPAQLALDPCSGSAVVVGAETGKVLACVTYPGYDNNRLANQMDNQYYYQLYNDLSIPFYSRATQQLTAPGSTFKPVTVIAGIQENVINSNTAVFCDGVFDKVAPSLKCWNWAGHGEIINSAGALEHSCNDYLCEISYRLGMIGNNEFADDQALDYLQEYAKLFDLDKKSGIEITESAPQITDHYAIPSAIGQGTHNYTTVQLARYVNTLATKGTSFQLSLIKEFQQSDAENEESYNSKVQSNVQLSDDVWNTVGSGMEQYAKSDEVLKDIKMNIAGKSGTAQESKTRPDHALFVGYAPAENAEISVAVRIANGYTSGNAVRVGRDILDYYFDLEREEDILSGNASASIGVRTD